MKTVNILILSFVLMVSCVKVKTESAFSPENWKARAAKQALPKSLIKGSTYLSVYSQIYSLTEHRTHDLTVTVSMRNTSKKDKIYLNKAEYFDTKGQSIRVYFDQTIFINPMETVEIIIGEIDKVGGTGGNFMFDWQIKPNSNEPFFESIMISTSGQQGLSFTSQGKRVK